MTASASALSGGSTAHAEIVAETEGPSNESLGIILFIVSEAVMFGAFFAQYFYNRVLSDSWPTRAGLPPGFDRVPAFPLPAIMTVLLVASGFTAHWAQSAIRRDDRDQFQGWLIVTILLGVSFLGAQAYWRTDPSLPGALFVPQPLRRGRHSALLALRRRRLDRSLRHPLPSLTFSLIRYWSSPW